MNIEQTLSPELIQALGWTVVHSIWQATTIAFVLAILLGIFKSKSSNFKYNISVLALATVTFSFIGTFAYEYSVLDYQTSINNAANLSGAGSLLLENLFMSGGQATAIGGETLNNLLQTCLNFIHSQSSNIVCIWLIGMIFFLLKLVSGLVYIERLKNQAVAIQESKWNNIFEELMNQVSISKPVRLCESQIAKSPMTVGFFKPLILVPASLLSGLEAQTIQAIIAHELAHIQRKDYLMNIAQVITESVLYYHPAVWWISEKIRTERENCCDDFAVKLCNSEMDYAKSLLELENTFHQQPQLAMAIVGKQKHLLYRIKRILNQPQKTSNKMEKFIVGFLLLFAVAGLSFTISAENEIIETKQAFDNNNEIQEIEAIVLNAETESLSREKIIEQNAAENTAQNTAQNKELDESIATAFESNFTDSNPLNFISNISHALLENYELTAPKILSGITEKFEGFPTMIDSSKRSSKQKIRINENGNETELEIKDGEVQKLRINGKLIPESEYVQHQELIDDILNGLGSVQPPLPPNPPSITRSPKVPRPPVNPVAPAAPAHPFGGQTIITKDENGETQITIQNGNSNSTAIEIIDGQVYIDGKLLENQDTVINNNYNNGNSFHFDTDKFEKFDLNSDNFFKSFNYNFDVDSIINGSAFNWQELNGQNFDSLFNGSFNFFDDGQMDESMAKLFESLEQMEGANSELFNNLEEQMETLQDRFQELEIEGLFPDGINSDDSDDQLINRIESELLKDGLIESSNKYSLELNKKELKINGKKQEDQTWLKYKNIYEDSTGSKMNKSNFMIRKNSDNNGSNNKSKVKKTIRL